MTTIAYKNGIMASDSCWAYDDIQTSSINKIARLKSGGLLGQAGDADSRCVVAAFTNVKTEKQLPSREDMVKLRVDFDGVLVLPNGSIFIISMAVKKDGIEAQVWPAGRRGVAAVGSGKKLALGAMLAGASARDAVAIACDQDLNSRLPVHTATIAPVRKKK